MKVLLAILILTTSGLAKARDRDEVLSQKIEAMILDGEDDEDIEEEMTKKSVTLNDLDLEE